MKGQSTTRTHRRHTAFDESRNDDGARRVAVHRRAVPSGGGDIGRPGSPPACSPLATHAPAPALAMASTMARACARRSRSPSEPLARRRRGASSAPARAASARSSDRPRRRGFTSAARPPTRPRPPIPKRPEPIGRRPSRSRSLPGSSRRLRRCSSRCASSGRTDTAHAPRLPRLTHGFHEYPAGMGRRGRSYPDVLPGDSLLDPFMEVRVSSSACPRG